MSLRALSDGEARGPVETAAADGAGAPAVAVENLVVRFGEVEAWA